MNVFLFTLPPNNIYITFYLMSYKHTEIDVGMTGDVISQVHSRVFNKIYITLIFTVCKACKNYFSAKEQQFSDCLLCVSGAGNLYKPVITLIYDNSISILPTVITWLRTPGVGTQTYQTFILCYEQLSLYECNQGNVKKRETVCKVLYE